MNKFLFRATGIILLLANLSIAAQSTSLTDTISIDLSNPKFISYPLHLITLSTTDRFVLTASPTLTMRLGTPFTGKATYEFNVSRTGKYQVWAFVKWPDSCHNSLWLTHQGKKILIGNNKTYQKWHWSKGPILHLKNKVSTLTISAREANVLCADLLLVPISTPFHPNQLFVNISEEPVWAQFRFMRQLILLSIIQTLPGHSLNDISKKLIYPYEINLPINHADAPTLFLSIPTFNYETDLAYAKILKAAKQTGALSRFISNFKKHPYEFKLKHILAQTYLESNKLKAARSIYIDIISTHQGICDLNGAYEELAAIDLVLYGSVNNSLNTTRTIQKSNDLEILAAQQREQGNLRGYLTLLEHSYKLDEYNANKAIFVIECHYILDNLKDIKTSIIKLLTFRKDSGLSNLYNTIIQSEKKANQ